MHLTLHLTRACNMRCRYCYAPPMTDAGMSLPTGLQAMDFGLRLTQGSCGIVFFGGEPLLQRELLLDLVRHARMRQRLGEGQFHFKITTNGLLLDDAFLEQAVRDEIMIAMSFDGIREAHDAHRRAPDGTGTFSLLLPRLQRLLERKPYSNIIMVVNPDTVRHMAKSVEFLFDMGVRYLVLALNYAGNWQQEHLEILREQYVCLARRYVRWTLAGRKFYFSPFEVKLASHINGDRFDQERCDFGRRQLSVDPDGYLYPCVQFAQTGGTSRWCVGHVSRGIDQTRLDALNVEAGAEKSSCQECDLKSRCSHTCACLNWQTTGMTTSLSPVLCAHEKMLIETADRIGNILYRRRSSLFVQKHYNPAYPLVSLVEDHAR